MMIKNESVTNDTGNLSSAKRALLQLRLRGKVTRPSTFLSIPKRSESEQPILASTQQRLWYLDQLEPNTAVYNIPSAFMFSGIINLETLKKSINEIIRRHEVLRTRFDIENGQPLQVIASSLSLDVPLIDLQNNPPNERWQSLRHLLKSEAQIPSDLARGPLIRAVIIKLSEEEHVFLFIAHHIV
ncbi:MAG: non-ribosomal peptide synthetase, partial [Planctomycetes bacterium]|nr:non-ribosomal peptide synthetase [Planctomycetota bacterium]